MKYLIIFVLFLVACSDVNYEKCPPFEVTISDALPIQFWLSDCETYNEKEVWGIHNKCWCHPWQCDDELVIQFTDTAVSEYVLRVIDSDNEVIDEIPFDTTQFTEDAFIDLPFSDWVNIPYGGNPWSIDSTPSVVIPSVFVGVEYSDYLSTPLEVKEGGIYNINYNVTASGSGFSPLSMELTFLNKGVIIGNISLPLLGGVNAGSVYINLSSAADEFRVSGSKLLPGPKTLTINSPFSMIVRFRDVVYTARFTPSETSPIICSQKVQFKIVEVGISPEREIAKSDCVDIQASQIGSTLIEYSNNRNIFGLVYEDLSPMESFKTRIPAIFFHERFPEEDNVIELTSSIQKTSSQLKAQRLLDVDYVPYYMHRKIKLILSHQNVLIDNQYWTKEEEYEVQDGERRWPVKKGKCFLTEKNYVQRAIL